MDPREHASEAYSQNQTKVVPTIVSHQPVPQVALFETWRMPELFADYDAKGREEFSLTLSVGTELAQVRPLAIKPLHAVVADIGHVDRSISAESDADRICKLSVARASGSKLTLVDSILVEFLHPVISAICKVNVAARVNRGLDCRLSHTRC